MTDEDREEVYAAVLSCLGWMPVLGVDAALALLLRRDEASGWRRVLQ